MIGAAIGVLSGIAFLAALDGVALKMEEAPIVRQTTAQARTTSSMRPPAASNVIAAGSGTAESELLPPPLAKRLMSA